MKKRITLLIYGKVQGVLYRKNAQNEALRLNLTGLVQNEINGAVKVTAEGEEKKLKEFIQWCWKGPNYAKVDDIKIIWEADKKEFNNFEIKH